ncbi:puromycin-sensitive aminopeptidase [Rhypophila sp. PSN 637]
MANPTNLTQLVGVMPAPEGVTPDFFSRTSTQTTFIALFAIMWALASVGVVLRLYTRAFLVKNLGWDEPLLLASWIITFAFSIMSIKAMPAGFGRHMYEVSPEQLGAYLETLVVLALTYIWPPAITKLSILVLYWRISPEKYFRTAVAATAFVLLSSSAIITIIFLAPCDPMLGTPESAVCLNRVAVAQAVINIVTDVIIILLPIPTTYSLHMPLKQKISVGIVLALGSGACIASIGRVAYVRAMVDNPDFTFTQGSAALWSIVEMNLGVLCNCLAVMKPFIRRHMPYLMSASSGTGETDPSYGKRSKSNGKSWGHSYQLHGIGSDKMDATDQDPGGSNPTRHNDIVVDHQFTVEFDQRTKRTVSKGDSTVRILQTLQYPAHRPV